MKKLFAIVAVMGVLTFGSTQLAQAQDAPAAEQTFGWKGKPIVLTMYVYPGSTAEKYAVEKGYALQYMDQ